MKRGFRGLRIVNGVSNLKGKISIAHLQLLSAIQLFALHADWNKKRDFMSSSKISLTTQSSTLSAEFYLRNSALTVHRAQKFPFSITLMYFVVK